MARDDERNEEEMRPIEVSYERLDRVDGSCRFGFGQTCALVSISGPLESRLAFESPSQAVLDISVRPLANVPGTDTKALAAILKSVLTPSLLLSQHPRTLIQIVGQALCGNESGSGMGSVGRGWNISLVAALINATTAAIISAGSIPMKGIVCAAAVGKIAGIFNQPPALVLDPSERELASLTGGGCFAFLFSSTLSTEEEASRDVDIPAHTMIWTNYATSSTTFDSAEWARSTKLAEAGAVAIWRRLKESVRDLETRTVTASRSKAKKEKNAKKDVGTDDEKMEI
ncbi:exosome non-catalytic core subunit rrp46 [Steccherinum ochraceum]|uniref:Exosome non-catalytic core subunit rrp46 n=1 Tax=Steccherinum ochraceum TaxID=92696 RepID=A0A4R0RYV7_9APHY|nr:exosome non-catalytic core subunit rrp46 [Steccherinum ochraceum]